MKKITCMLLAAMMAVSMMVLIPADSVSAASGSTIKVLKWSSDPTAKTIKLKWKKQKVSYYNIYRLEPNTTDSGKITPQPFAKYKKVKKVSGKKTSWTDKKVKPGYYYAYVIRGFKKTKTGLVRVCDSYMEGVIQYDCPGLARPDIYNDGLGDSYDNSKDRIYLCVDRDSAGIRPSGAVIYRKAGKTGKYKKISVKKMDKGKFNTFVTYRDTSVKPGKIYYYKTKTWYKKNGKKKYSAYSRAIRIPAVNNVGRYTIKAVSPAGTKGAFDISVTSAKYNGKTVFYPGKIWTYVADGKGYVAKLAQYSSDGKTWTNVPSGGISLPEQKQVWLRYTFASSAAAFQGGYAGDGLYTEYGVKYDGSAGYARLMNIDLVKGTGKAYTDYDY